MAKAKRDDAEPSALELNPEIEENSTPVAPAPAAELPAASPEERTADLREEIRNAPKQENRQDQPAPECPCCKVACLSKNSDEFYTRYYCPNGAACPMNFSLKVLRPYARRVLTGRRNEPDEPYAARP